MGGFIKPLKKSVIMHFIRTLEELLEASPDAYHAAKERIGRCKNRTIPDVLRELREIRSLNGSLKSLYALKKKGKEFDLACLLHFFPPETIYGEFSEDTFLWLLAEKEKYFFTYEWSDDDVQKLTGKNKRTMVRASTTAAEMKPMIVRTTISSRRVKPFPFGSSMSRTVSRLRSKRTDVVL